MDDRPSFLGSYMTPLAPLFLRGDLVEVAIVSGRPHQIRAQLAHIGCPIVGDAKYGAKRTLPEKNIALAATSLSFKTATGNEVKTIFIDIPFNL